MSEIKLFEGAEIVTRDGSSGVVVKNSAHKTYPWFVLIDSTQLIKNYTNNGHFDLDCVIHCLDIVKILNPEDAPDFRENNGWLPIETAPKDGTKIILFGTSRSPIGVSPQWKTENLVGEGCFTAGIWQFKGIGEPTHWQPLPKPPEE